MGQLYRQNLAYIHDVGYSDYALQATPGILKIFAQHAIHDGLILDLGCGSGWSAQEFVRAGYQVLGIDISEALIVIARRRVPEAIFHSESLYQVEIPSCEAVTAIGECLNYWLDQAPHQQHLIRLFQRVYQALQPGGIFLFDIAEPGQLTIDEPIKHFTEGEDWLVTVEKTEDKSNAVLTRRIITFCQVGETYRRDDELHTLQLYPAATLAENLCQVGFTVNIQRSYGEFVLPPAHAVLIARKPTREG